MMKCARNEVLSFSQGTKLLFYNSAADVLLLDLPSAIPDRYKPYYVGEHSHPYPLLGGYIDCDRTLPWPFFLWC